MIDLVTFGLAGLWVLLWAVILVVVLSRKFAGKATGEGEILPKPPPLLHRLQRIVLWVFVAVFLARVVANQLGWDEGFMD